MIRRLVATAVAAVTASILLLLATAGPAAADNCGSLSDCLPSAKGILIALAAVLIIVGIVAIGFGGAALLAAALGGGGFALAGGGVVASAGAISVAAAAEIAGAGALATATGVMMASAASSSGGSGGSSGGSSSGSSSAEAEASRLRALGEDPATGQFRQAEMETAQRVETQTGVRLERSTNPNVDWVDANGKTYDAVGNFDGQYFQQQWPNLQTRIVDHLAKADYVPIDVAKFTPAQVTQVQQFIQNLGPRVFLVGM